MRRPTYIKKSHPIRERAERLVRCKTCGNKFPLGDLLHGYCDECDDLNQLVEEAEDLEEDE